MTGFQKFLLFVALLVSFIVLFQLRALSRDIKSLEKKAKLNENPSLSFDSKRSANVDPESSFEHSDAVSSSDVFIRGDYQYCNYGNRPVLYFDDCLIEIGMITEYGKCLNITRSSTLCVDGLKRTFLLPRRAPAGPPKTTAFVPAPRAEGMRL